jgi:hypothetical protein
MTPESAGKIHPREVELAKELKKLGAAEPQPNRKENSRGGAETQRKNAD